MFQLVHMHGIWIFQEGGHSLVSFGWGGGGLFVSERIRWLFGTARGLEALGLGAGSAVGFGYLAWDNGCL